MVRIFIVILFIFCANLLKAQQKQVLRSIIVNGDTIPHVWLDDAFVRERTKNPAFYRRYERERVRLEYNVRKVYPYAKIAANKINEIEYKLSQVHRESEKKKIIKEEYAGLMKTFKAPLTQLSVNQGKILVRLIYRETSNTSFSHIREYKGGVNAYFWQSLALLFGNNLKAAYNPYGADAEIEEIVLKIQQEKI